MTNSIVFVNGEFKRGPLTISAADAGFVFGATVTDFVRTFHQELYRFDDHLQRFRESCQLCHVPLLIDDNELRAAAEELIAQNSALLSERDSELGLVLLATPGPLGRFVSADADGPPSFMMHAIRLPVERYRSLFSNGAVLVVPATRALAAESIDPRSKMRSRMHWWIAEQQAHSIDPQSSALLTDAHGYVTETAAANFLIVKDGAAISPPRATILNGVSLQVIEELCGKLGISFVERPLTVQMCLEADEAMLTCTTYCMAGVRKLQGVELPWPGPIWRRILAAWSKVVGIDIENQFIG